MFNHRPRDVSGNTHALRRRRSAVVLAGTAAAALIAGCGGNPAPAPADATATATATKVPVVASTNVYGALAAAVGGDRVQVTSFINDPTADPHEFEVTPADAAKVAGAKVVVFNGGGYDDFMGKIVAAAGPGDRAVVDVTQVSGLPTGPDFNEHLWYNLPVMQKVVGTLAADLSKADPAGAATYQAGAAAATTKLKDLQARTAAIAAKHAGQRVAITEPVPGYLIEAAHLTNATPPEFSEAVEEGTDAPAAVVQKELALFAPPDPVRALLLNVQTETPTTKQVHQAADTGHVPIVDVSETLPAGINDYFTWMGGEIDSLATALNR